MMSNQIAFKSFCRCISTSSTHCGKRNFRKFNLYEKRGSANDKKYLKTHTVEEIIEAHDRGIRPTGYKDESGVFHEIAEMKPEIIVPDLTGFELKPYVSYRVTDVVQGEFTPQDLFYAIYSKKIAQDFKDGKLNDDGSPVEPSYEEKLDKEEAWKRAKRTGSDVYG